MPDDIKPPMVPDRLDLIRRVQNAVIQANTCQAVENWQSLDHLKGQLAWDEMERISAEYPGLWA